MNEIIKAVSLFSGAGIGELLIPKNKFKVIAANEVLKKRADCYSFFYPETKVVCGDIRENIVKKELITLAKKEKAKLLIATPPCQGFSTLGKNKKQDHYENDKRNFLIFDVLEIIDSYDFDFILIENVPKFLDMVFPINDEYLTLEEILKLKYSDRYNIEVRILNAKDYGVAQSRPRAIVKISKLHIDWNWPIKEKEISLRTAIGTLPSLEPGMSSNLTWHYAKKQNERITTALRHTPEGKSAIANKVFYPKKADGTRIKGFHNTYKRMCWDLPCPARTTYCGSVSSHNNVHPGVLKEDGTYSDPRVLTLLETFIVSSIPRDIKFPPQCSDSFIREIIGESIPPLLMRKILDCINVESKNAYND